MVGGLRDVITCAEFQIEIFMGYDFTGGRIFDFSIDFSIGLTTVQRYCAACDPVPDVDARQRMSTCVAAGRHVLTSVMSDPIFVPGGRGKINPRPVFCMLFSNPLEIFKMLW